MSSILTRAETVPWLSAVGSALSSTDGLYRPSLDEWRRYVTDAVKHEFGLDASASASTSPIEDIDWLGDDGLNPNRDLADRLPQLLTQPRLREQRLAVTRTVLRGLRSIPPSPWLRVGGTDFHEAVKQAASFCFRMALAEEYWECVGFWHDVVSWYELGFWPAGVIRDGRLVVL